MVVAMAALVAALRYRKRLRRRRRRPQSGGADGGAGGGGLRPRSRSLRGPRASSLQMRPLRWQLMDTRRTAEKAMEPTIDERKVPAKGHLGRGVLTEQAGQRASQQRECSKTRTAAGGEGDRHGRPTKKGVVGSGCGVRVPLAPFGRRRC